MTTARTRVTTACSQIRQAGAPVPVTDLARAAGCSPRQLQRDFAEVLRISPRQYGQAVRTERTRHTLRSTGSVLDGAFTAGYGSVRAFYEEAARRLGMTPSEYAAGAPDQVLLWSCVATTVGDVVAVAAPRGLAAVRIAGAGASLEVLAEELTAEFHGAALVRDDAAMSDVMRALVALAAGHRAAALPVEVQGTAFQARVWQALQEIPAGQTRTYAQVADQIGEPTATRAVARACATNKVALVVPCHRVIRGDGSLAGYRWGLAVKASLLEAERA
jgi:AraC family transcriptional regulator of adaptative response/methylated-DNA-[protein]-cysteine methyltransferase